MVVGCRGGEKATQSLSEVLVEDQDPLVRRIAALALARLPSPEARWVLEWAALGVDEYVRQAAAWALAQWEEQSIAP